MSYFNIARAFILGAYVLFVAVGALVGALAGDFLLGAVFASAVGLVVGAYASIAQIDEDIADWLEKRAEARAVKA